MFLARSVVRVVVAMGVFFAAAGIVVSGPVDAAGKEINATLDPGRCDKQWGPPCFSPGNGSLTQVNQGERVTWKALDGTHTVTPADGTSFAGSGDLTGPNGTFSATFDKPGTYSFYCKNHGSVESGGKVHHGMWGRIEVKAPATTTTTAPTPPTSGPPSKPDPGPPPTNPPATAGGSTAPNGSSNSGSGSNGQTAAGSGKPFVGPPSTQPPAPRVAASPPPEPESPLANPKDKERDRDREKGRGDREEGDQASPPEATALPPDEAVLPPSPQFPTATTTPPDEPAGAPPGDSIAVLKGEPGGETRRLALFVTLFGVGALGVGVGGWKFAHRSSKYWPA